jgi:CRP-like cAMP-binding protein
MAHTGILAAFNSHAFLRGLSDRLLMTLATGVQPFQADDGKVLAREGDTADAFYLVQDGRIELGRVGESGAFVRLAAIGPGEVVGWSWLVPPHRWLFAARAAGRVSGLVFNGKWLREKCEQDHELGYHLLMHLVTVIAGRLVATREQVRELGKGNHDGGGI